MSEANKAFIRRFVEEVQNQHNTDAFDGFFSPSFVNYDIAPGFSGTREGGKQLHKMFFAALPDLQVTIHDQAAEGDRVWTRKTFSGTHHGELFGVPATGKHVSWDIIDIMTIKDGQITEHWVVADVMGLMQQLGTVPQQQN